VGDQFDKFSALRTTASAACQDRRKHTHSVLAEVPSEVAGHDRKLRPHHQSQVCSAVGLGAKDGLEAVERHLGVITPQGRLIIGLLKRRSCMAQQVGLGESCCFAEACRKRAKIEQYSVIHIGRAEGESRDSDMDLSKTRLIESVFAGGGEMGARMRALDWSAAVLSASLAAHRRKADAPLMRIEPPREPDR
jgi:hypothetical protein